ncbi:MAG: hypothetical protein ACLQVI_30045 [Polyangiaceae bacterium]
MRWSLIALSLAIVSGPAGCRGTARDSGADAGSAAAALTGQPSAAYAEEVALLCGFVPLGRLTAKPDVRSDADPVAFLREQAARAGEPRTRSLIARVLASAPGERGAAVRAAYVGEAKPMLPALMTDPSAPTAPWGNDPKPRESTCLLADRLDGVVH